MLEFIIGDIVDIKDDYIVLQCNNIGYRIYTSSNSIANVEFGMKNVLFYTYLNVREDGIFLYGFTTEDELDIFKLLLLVSKIGPKIAIGLLSYLTPNQIKKAIINKDIDILCKAPGIGKKTAERIILELKDKVDRNATYEENYLQLNKGNDYMEAVHGLISLGYTKHEIEKAMEGIDVSRLKVEDIIREALKRLSQN
ncbi:MAG TPA: Holliday junction branch migration protein RuvA [Tissierellaceae bacterium]